MVIRVEKSPVLRTDEWNVPGTDSGLTKTSNENDNEPTQEDVTQWEVVSPEHAERGGNEREYEQGLGESKKLKGAKGKKKVRKAKDTATAD